MKSDVSKVLFAATITLGIVMGLTVLEDLLTGGSGAINDIPSLAVAGGLAAKIFGL